VRQYCAKIATLLQLPCALSEDMWLLFASFFMFSDITLFIFVRVLCGTDSITWNVRIEYEEYSVEYCHNIRMDLNNVMMNFCQLHLHKKQLFYVLFTLQ
jgi:hypothetical protein